MKAHWVLSLASWTVSGALLGGTVAARIVSLAEGEPAVAEVLYTPTPLPKPTPTLYPTATIVPTATLVPTPRPTIPISPVPKAAASAFAR